MKVTQKVNYNESNRAVRQNAHINSQLIKNNSQKVNIRQSHSPVQNMPLHNNIMSIQPIQMTFNPHQVKNRPISFVSIQQAESIQRSNQNNYGTIIRSPQIASKNQVINRSNSSSRAFSNYSGVQYINVGGDTQKNIRQLGQGSVKKQILVQQPIQMIPIQKNVANLGVVINPTNARPQSNMSNQSSQSRNSSQSRQIPNVSFNINQSKSLSNFGFKPPGFDQNGRNTSQSRLNPSPPPVTINYVQPNVVAQKIIRPAPINIVPIHTNMPQNHQINYQNQVKIESTSPTKLINNNHMRTSEVKVIYQRGSYSPNQHLSSEGSNSNNLSQNSSSPKMPNRNIQQKQAATRQQKKNSQKLSGQQLSPRDFQNQKKYMNHYKNYINEQKSNQKITGNDNNVKINKQKMNDKQLIKQIKSTPVQSVIVGQQYRATKKSQEINMDSQSNSSPSAVISYQIQSSSSNGQVQTINQSNNKNKIITKSNKINQKINSLKRIPQPIDYNQRVKDTYIVNNEVKNSSINNRADIPLQKLQNNIQSIQTFRPAANQIAKNDGDIQGSVAQTYKQSPGQHQPQVNQIKKIYKSYDEYLQETKKPENIVKEIQESQLRSHINIQYRLAQPVMNQADKKGGKAHAIMHQQMYRSQRIPSVYGSIDSNTANNKFQNHQNQGRGFYINSYDSNDFVVLGSHNMGNNSSSKKNYQNLENQTQGAMGNNNNPNIRQENKQQLHKNTSNVMISSFGRKNNTQNISTNMSTNRQAFKRNSGQNLYANMDTINSNQYQQNAIHNNYESSLQANNILLTQAKKTDIINDYGANTNVNTDRNYNQNGHLNNIINQGHSRGLTTENISTIKQQSQQYDNDYQYSSSSLIGSTLQDHLRLGGASSNRQLSDFEPDSWLKSRYENVFTNANHISPYFTNSPPGVLNPTNTNAGHVKGVNPFQVIQQKQKVRNDINYTNDMQIYPSNRNYQNSFDNHNINSPSSNNNNNIISNINNHIPGIDVASSINHNASSYNSIKLNAKKDTQYQQHLGNQRIQQKLNRYDNINNGSSNMSTNNWIKTHAQSNNNISTKDRLGSQKLISNYPAVLARNKIQQINKFEYLRNKNTVQPQSHQNIKTYRNIVLNQEDQQLTNLSISFDIYQLIDDIYNRQLQNGINKIRETFVRALKSNTQQFTD